MIDGHTTPLASTDPAAAMEERNPSLEAAP
jgi:hypothetical protein